jgi:hypothetical protein
MDKPIGHIVTWRVPQKVALDALRISMQEAGIDEKLAGDLHPRHALARALREIAREQPRVVRRFKNGEEGVLKFQLTREYLEEQGIEYRREAVLRLQDGQVTGDEPVIVERARDLLTAHLAQRLTSDLTRLVQRVVSAAGTDLIPVREQGGAYFVPEGHAVVLQLAALLEKIGGKLSMFSVTLGHGTEQSVAETVTDYLLGQIDELREAMKDVTSDSRSDVKARRLARVGELKQRLATYGTLLAGYAERVGQEVSKIETEVLAVLTKQAVTAEELGL